MNLHAGKITTSRTVTFFHIYRVDGTYVDTETPPVEVDMATTEIYEMQQRYPGDKYQVVSQNVEIPFLLPLDIQVMQPTTTPVAELPVGARV